MGNTQPAAAAAPESPPKNRRLSLTSKVDEAADKFAALAELEQMTGVPKTYLFIGFACLLVSMCAWGFGVIFLTHIIGVCYPAYRSFKAIDRLQQLDAVEESGVQVATEEQRTAHRKVTKYLMYWIFYGSFTIAETLSDFILFWIPFYYPMKLGFLLWCVHPTTEGSKWVYDNLIQPGLQKHQETIDFKLAKIQTTANNVLGEITQESGEVIRTATNTVITKVMQAQASRLSNSNDPGDDKKKDE